MLLVKHVLYSGVLDYNKDAFDDNDDNTMYVSASKSSKAP